MGLTKLIAMNVKYILPLIALGLASAHAGERETFDFGWKFKYFGGFDPADAGSPTWCDGYQGGHPASHAVDGNMDTRWCAPDSENGHILAVAPGFEDPVKLFLIYWEFPCDFDVHIKVVCYDESKNFELSFNQGGQAASFVQMEEPAAIRYVIVTVPQGAHSRQWMSVREILFTGADNKPLKVKRGPSATVHSAVGASEVGYKNVQLPHDWAIESPFLEAEPNETGKLPWNGWGWYRKHFDVPADFDSSKDRWYLDFDGVMSRPQIYVNGQKAGEWAYGYNSFRVDITPYLKPGEDNLVAVMASNLPLSTRWYPGAGIYRHVWLEKTGPVHLTQWPTYVTTPEITKDYAVVKVQTTVSNTGNETAEISVQQTIEGAFAAPAYITLAPGTEGVVEQELRIPSPRLWSCESPELYKLQTRVIMNGAQIDSRETTFGVRSIEWKKDGFYLNGERVRLKGVCEHHDLGALGAAFHTRAYERKIEILKEMGCNSIRMTHNPPAPEVLELCDKHGILVIDELFDIWKRQKYEKVNGYHIYWDAWWKKDVRNFMLRDRNHPCIIAWSGGNEIMEQSMYDLDSIRANRAKYSSEEKFRRSLRDAEAWNAMNLSIGHSLRDEIRKYDVTRPYTVGCNDQNAWKHDFIGTMDIYGFNYKPHLYDDFRLRHPDMPYYGSETCSCVGTRDTYNFPLDWRVGGGYFKPGAVPHQVSAYALASTHWGCCPDIEMHAQTKAPDIAGEYVWTGFDYIGEPTPYGWPARSSFFGIVDLAGFPKDVYYLYQSEWTDKEVLHLFPHWNWEDGQEIDMWCYYNDADEVELFVNGVSQGIRSKTEDCLHTVWRVIYEPGTVEVVARKEGREVRRKAIHTAGEPAAIRLTKAQYGDKAEDDALCYVTVEIVDAEGNLCPDADNLVTFDVEGPAFIAGVDNGNPVSMERFKDNKRKAFYGKCLVVLETGDAGKTVLTAESEGLASDSVTFTVR